MRIPPVGFTVTNRIWKYSIKIWKFKTRFQLWAYIKIYSVKSTVHLTRNIKQWRLKFFVYHKQKKHSINVYTINSMHLYLNRYSITTTVQYNQTNKMPVMYMGSACKVCWYHSMLCSKSVQLFSTRWFFTEDMIKTVLASYI